MYEPTNLFINDLGLFLQRGLALTMVLALFVHYLEIKYCYEIKKKR